MAFPPERRTPTPDSTAGICGATTIPPMLGSSPCSAMKSGHVVVHGRMITDREVSGKMLGYAIGSSFVVGSPSSAATRCGTIASNVKAMLSGLLNAMALSTSPSTNTWRPSVATRRRAYNGFFSIASQPPAKGNLQPGHDIDAVQNVQLLVAEVGEERIRVEDINDALRDRQAQPGDDRARPSSTLNRAKLLPSSRIAATATVDSSKIGFSAR